MNGKRTRDLVDATWWQDWTAWIAERGGEMIPAPDHQGNDDYPPIEKAPGSYVRATCMTHSPETVDSDTFVLSIRRSTHCGADHRIG